LLTFFGKTKKVSGPAAVKRVSREGKTYTARSAPQFTINQQEHGAHRRAVN
jgi:hypothetical protein